MGRTFVGFLKDKVSIIKAAFSLNRHASSVHLAVIRATTHDPNSPPSEPRIAAVLALGRSSPITACACIEALMDRLHSTRSAPVALKCLFTIHSIISNGSFILREQIGYYPSFGGHNFLNLSTFCDNSDLSMWELSDWVRWFAGVVEQSLTVSRAIGYYLHSSEKRKDQEDKALGLLNSGLINDIQVLVDFVTQICDFPDSLDLQSNNLVYEVVRAAGEEYRSVQHEMLVRVKEVEDRVEGLSSDELTQLINSLKRLEDCRERLVVLFVNRKKNDVLWELVGRTKAKLMEAKEKREEKRLVVRIRSGRRDESTQFWNPFVEPGQLFLLRSGYEFLGLGSARITV